MKCEQLLLFEETTEEKLLRKMNELKDSQDKVRKGQFAKIGSNTKEISNIKERLDILERGICQSDIEERFRNLLNTFEALENEVKSLKAKFGEENSMPDSFSSFSSFSQTSMLHKF